MQQRSLPQWRTFVASVETNRAKSVAIAANTLCGPLVTGFALVAHPLPEFSRTVATGCSAMRRIERRPGRETVGRRAQVRTERLRLGQGRVERGRIILVSLKIGRLRPLQKRTVIADEIDERAIDDLRVDEIQPEGIAQKNERHHGETTHPTGAGTMSQSNEH
eukprot:gene28229-34197_t